jgi:hypothetical protein
MALGAVVAVVTAVGGLVVVVDVFFVVVVVVANSGSGVKSGVSAVNWAAVGLGASWEAKGPSPSSQEANVSAQSPTGEAKSEQLSQVGYQGLPSRPRMRRYSARSESVVMVKSTEWAISWPITQAMSRIG